MVCYNCFSESNSEICPHCGFSAKLDSGKYPQALPHGTILAGQYMTGRVLGQGGFGITYIAYNIKQRKKIALKEYMPNILAIRKGKCTVMATGDNTADDFQHGMNDFINEARSLSAFSSNPNTVHVYQCFKENGTAYFAMEYIEGINFKTYIANRGGKLPWKEALKYLFPVMTAMEPIHRASIIHRDLTPDNIFITTEGIVKILDFGSARFFSGSKTQTMDVLLKRGYAPVEQYYRKGAAQGPYTDVYSICACFYAAITGYVPPDAMERGSADNDKLMPPHMYGIDLPPEVESIILRGLALRHKDRWQNMTELRQALLNATSIQPDPVPQPQYQPQPSPADQGMSMPQQPYAPPKNDKTTVIILAVIFFILFFIIMLFIFSLLF